MRPAVFLDRDGVLNAMVMEPEHGIVDSPARPEDLRLLPGVAQAVGRINARGWLAVVVSNQPGVAKGRFTLSLLAGVTGALQQGLARGGARLDGIYYCLHHPEAVLSEYRHSCSCRKPSPGLLWQAAADLEIDVRRSVMVGDGLTDIQAGRRAGCTTIWIGRRRCDVCEVMVQADARPHYIAGSLLEAVELITRREVEYGDFR